MHVCEQSECDKNNQENSLHFFCCLCRKKTLAECAYREFEEAKSVLTALKVICTDSKGTIKTKHNENRSIFDLVFGDDSHFSFTCQRCKEENMLNALKKKVCDSKTAIKNLTDANASMKKATELELGTKNEEIERLKQNVQEAQQQLNEKNKLIGELTEESDRPNHVTEHGIEAMTIANAISTQLMSRLGSLLETELDKIYTKVMHECNSMKEQCTKLLNDVGDRSKEPTKTNPFHKGKNRNVSFNFGGTLSSAAKTSTATNNDHTETNPNKTNENQTPNVFNGKLIPAKTTDKAAGEIHSIYVSQFTLDITVDDIIEHIMNNIERAKRDDVTVERLDKRNSDFLSFKISTAQNELYDEMMSIWAPHYTARKFVNATSDSPQSRTKTPTKTWNFSTHGTPRHGNYRSYNHTPKRQMQNNRYGNNNGKFNSQNRSKRGTYNNSVGQARNVANEKDKTNGQNQQQQAQSNQNENTPAAQQFTQQIMQQQPQQAFHQQPQIALPYQTNNTASTQTGFLGTQIIQQPQQMNQLQQQQQYQIMPSIQYQQQQNNRQHVPATIYFQHQQ